MKDVCPNCEKVSEIEVINSMEEIKVRGELIEVPVRYFKCLDCNSEFEDPTSTDDPLEFAFREYRKRHCLLQPSEIKDFRNKIQLSQSELSKLLGFGGATLSRYENGALQDEVHDKALRFAMEPNNLLKLIESSPEVLTEYKKNEIIKKINSSLHEIISIERAINDRIGLHEPNEYSGYKRLDFNKLINAILIFCEEGLLTTLLNKFLYYSDFLHFKKYSVSITGVQYAHMNFGPAPDKYSYYYSLIENEKYLNVDEVLYKDYSGYKYKSAQKADLSVFSESELLCLLQVKEFFKSFTATQISEYSHGERGFEETVNGQLISYNYANTLNLDLNEKDIQE